MHSKIRRNLLGVIVPAVLVVWSAPPAAAQTYPIAGNVRYQVGNLIPVPVTVVP